VLLPSIDIKARYPLLADPVPGELALTDTPGPIDYDCAEARSKLIQFTKLSYPVIERYSQAGTVLAVNIEAQTSSLPLCKGKEVDNKVT